MCYLSGSIEQFLPLKIAFTIKTNAEFYFNQVERYYVPARRNDDARADELRGRINRRAATVTAERFVFCRRLPVFFAGGTESVYPRDLDERFRNTTYRRHPGFDKREHRNRAVGKRRRAGLRDNRFVSNRRNRLMRAFDKTETPASCNQDAGVAVYLIFFALAVRAPCCKISPVTFPSESFSNVIFALT
jgi:hypothetical protein